MQVFDVSSCLLFSCLSTYFTDWYLVYPFFTARIFRSVTPQAKIGVLFQAWNISDFYARGRNIMFFSLAFCTYACLLISRTGILIIFFTLRMFRSVTAYARFFFVLFCLLFPRLSTFLCELILCLPLSRSEYVVLIHYRLLKPTFDKDLCLHHLRSDRFTCRIFSLLRVFFLNATVPWLLFF